MADVPLRDYVDGKVCALERTVMAKIAAVERAVEKAEHAIDLRLQGMNEFREALKDQAGHFVTREESETWRTAIRDRLTSIQSSVDKAEGRGVGVRELWAWMLGAVALIGMILALAEKF